MRAARCTAFPCTALMDRKFWGRGKFGVQGICEKTEPCVRRHRASLSAILITTFVSLLAIDPAHSNPLAAGALGTTDLRSHLPLLVHKVFVFGKDDRKKLPAKYRHLDYKIGFLYSSTTNHVCTASCVASDVILTAAHCALISGKKKRRFPDTKGLKFYLKHPDIPDFPIATNVLNADDVTPRNVVSGSPVTRAYRGTKFRGDWAFIKLPAKACMSGHLPLRSFSRKGIARASKNGKLLEVAFHGDRDFGKELLITENCKIKGGKAQRRRRNRSLILHTCDLTEGASGSPLLVKTASGLSIVGLNVGGILRRKVLKRGRKIVKRYKSRAVHNIAVDVSLFIDRLAEIRAVNPVDNETDIRLLQQALRERKLYKGKLDGMFGPGTWNAIRKFEKKKKWPVLGLPTKLLLRELGADKQYSQEARAETREGFAETDR